MENENPVTATPIGQTGGPAREECTAAGAETAGPAEQSVRVLLPDGVRTVDPVTFSASALGRSLDFTSDVAAGPDGRVYLLKRSQPPILVTDESGRVVDTWGEGVVKDPHGGCVDQQGRLWVTDRDSHCVLRFDTRGEVDLVLGEAGVPAMDRPFNHPAGVAVAPDGRVLVADGYGNASVHYFSPEGAYLRSWGGHGAAPGCFSTPHDVVVTSTGIVHVADRENDRVQSFGLDGEYLGELRDVYRPMALAVDDRDNLHVTDQVPRLSVFSATGALLARSRPVPYMPHGLTVCASGDVILAESAPDNRATLLSRPNPQP